MAVSKEDVLFVIFAILSILVFVWYIFGRSPTLEQSLLLTILTLLFNTNRLVAKNSKDIAVLNERLKNHLEKHE